MQNLSFLSKMLFYIFFENVQKIYIFMAHAPKIEFAFQFVIFASPFVKSTRVLPTQTTKAQNDTRGLPLPCLITSTRGSGTEQVPNPAIPITIGVCIIM
jgi:hypothetical protein